MWTSWKQTTSASLPSKKAPIAWQRVVRRDPGQRDTPDVQGGHRHRCVHHRASQPGRKFIQATRSIHGKRQSPESVHVSQQSAGGGRGDDVGGLRDPAGLRKVHERCAVVRVSSTPGWTGHDPAGRFRVCGKCSKMHGRRAVLDLTQRWPGPGRSPAALSRPRP